MKALRYGNRKVEVVEVPMPEAQPGEMLVKVLASAVCGSERPTWLRETDYSDNFLNFGHEAIGEVVDPNGSTKFKAGDRVCMQIMAGCGECYACKLGFYSACKHKRPKRRSVAGCHAQYVAMPEICFIPFDEDIPVDIGTLIGGDCLGLANRVAGKLGIEPGDWVFVCGAGPVGLGNIFTEKLLGARVIVSDPSPIRREFAREKAGADVVLDPTVQDVTAEIMKLTDGIGVAATVECSGTVVGETLCIDATRLQGHVCMCGENFGTLEIKPSFQIIHRELILQGASYFRVSDVAENIEKYRNGMNPEPLISDRVKLDDAPDVVNAFFEGKTGGKVIIYSND